MTIETKITTHAPGIYRIRTSNCDELFGQISKEGREWGVDIRRVDDGVMIRFGSNCTTKRDAIEEAASILKRELY